MLFQGPRSWVAETEHPHAENIPQILAGAASDFSLEPEKFRKNQVQSTEIQQQLEVLARESTGEGWLNQKLCISEADWYVFGKKKQQQNTC